jgi:hypothetical protein
LLWAAGFQTTNVFAPSQTIDIIVYRTYHDLLTYTASKSSTSPGASSIFDRFQISRRHTPFGIWPSLSALQMTYYILFTSGGLLAVFGGQGPLNLEQRFAFHYTCLSNSSSGVCERDQILSRIARRIYDDALDGWRATNSHTRWRGVLDFKSRNGSYTCMD